MIQDKFKNQRRLEKLRQKNKPVDEPDGRPAAKTRRVQGLPGYNPGNESSATATLRSINELKVASSEEEVAALMDATFSARRKAIVEEDASVSQIREDYPVLFAREQFWAEVARLAGRSDWLAHALDALEAWKRRVATNIACSEANALDQLERLLCGSGGLYAGGHVYLLRQPTSAFQLVVEGEAIMETSDKAEAFIALTMGHSVFNRKIGRKNKALCLFIQKVVLKIDDGSKLPGTVAKLCHELMA